MSLFARGRVITRPRIFLRDSSGFELGFEPAVPPSRLVCFHHLIHTHTPPPPPPPLVFLLSWHCSNDKTLVEGQRAEWRFISVQCGTTPVVMSVQCTIIRATVLVQCMTRVAVSVQRLVTRVAMSVQCIIRATVFGLSLIHI